MNEPEVMERCRWCDRPIFWSEGAWRTDANPLGDCCSADRSGGYHVPHDESVKEAQDIVRSWLVVHRWRAEGAHDHKAMP